MKLTDLEIGLQARVGNVPVPGAGKANWRRTSDPFRRRPLAATASVVFSKVVDERTTHELLRFHLENAGKNFCFVSDPRAVYPLGGDFFAVCRPDGVVGLDRDARRKPSVRCRLLQGT